MTLEFSFLSVGGVAAGLALGYGSGAARPAAAPARERSAHRDHAFAHDALRGLPRAEQLGGSGVLAVVAAGLYSGWRDPVRMDAETRQTPSGSGPFLIFWLNGIAFVLLGLQFPALYAAVHDQYSVLHLLGPCR